jgi:hypothetical protein
MSFHESFQKRWTEVIEKGISAIKRNGKPLEAVRVDTRRISDSVLTEILSGIGTSRLVLADVTTIHYMDGDRPIRNANVMYEVGIAHAMRLPEEVLLFRSDDDQLLFDVANVRVNKYSPDDRPDEARALIARSIIDALKELDLRRSFAVGRAAGSLDYVGWKLLSEAIAAKLKHPRMRTLGHHVVGAQRIAAIQRLLELGILQTSYLSITPELYHRMKDADDTEFLSYEVTEFGKAVFEEAMQRLGLQKPEMLALMQTEFENDRLNLQAQVQKASEPQEQSDLEQANR